MRVCLGEKKIYVKNTESLVYEVKYYEGYDGYDSLHFQLDLVCGCFFLGDGLVGAFIFSSLVV